MRVLRLLKPAVFVLCLVPLGLMVFDGFTGGLGVNPVEAITHRTGDWTLRLLLVTLAMTPLRRLSGWGWPLRVRRMLGLFSFFYACLHLLTYVWLDQFFDLWAIVEDVIERPFITVGMLAFVGLIPLAVTSTNGMMRRLGRRWKVLHRLVYAVAILGVVHFWWLVKADVREPLLYALILAGLLGYRVVGYVRRLRRARSSRLETGAGA
jgi:sulfoxide reductase heme-binding subunit YedZ